MNTVPPDCPYVGPRPYLESDASVFFGRDRELSELVSLINANPIVLLHAASGAGKSSLLRAGLIPALPPQEFLALPPMRVRGGTAPVSVTRVSDPEDVFTFNALKSLPENLREDIVTPSTGFLDYARQLEKQMDTPRDGSLLFVFDQFEELFTTNTEHWKHRHSFFRGLRDLLLWPRRQLAQRRDPGRTYRVLLVMRSDYIALLERFQRLVPELAYSRYELECLSVGQAQSAIECPLKGWVPRFRDGVARNLATELSKRKVRTGKGTSQSVEGEFVEPVQLQVVCKHLWDAIPTTYQRRSSEQSDNDRYEISEAFVAESGSVQSALGAYYDTAVARTARMLRISERKLRDWFARELITSARTRGLVFRGDTHTGTLPNDAVKLLEDEHHIVRQEERSASEWIELSHDQFIEPILIANELFTSRIRRRRSQSLAIGAVLLTVVGWIVRTDSERRETERDAQAQRFQRSLLLVNEAQTQLANEEYDIALLLAVEAVEASPNPEAIGNLGRILQAGLPSKLFRIENFVAQATQTMETGEIVVAGTRGTVGSVDGATDLVTLDTKSGSVLARSELALGAAASATAFSPDGRFLGAIVCTAAEERSRLPPHQYCTDSKAFILERTQQAWEQRNSSRVPINSGIGVSITNTGRLIATGCQTDSSQLRKEERCESEGTWTLGTEEQGATRVSEEGGSGDSAEPDSPARILSTTRGSSSLIAIPDTTRWTDRLLLSRLPILSRAMSAPMVDKLGNAVFVAVVQPPNQRGSLQQLVLAPDGHLSLGPMLQFVGADPPSNLISSPLSITVGPHQQHLAISSGYGGFAVFSAASAASDVFDALSGDPLWPTTADFDSQTSVGSVAFTADGDTVLWCDSEGVNEFTAETGTLKSHPLPSEIQALFEDDSEYGGLWCTTALNSGDDVLVSSVAGYRNSELKAYIVFGSRDDDVEGGINTTLVTEAISVAGDFLPSGTHYLAATAKLNSDTFSDADLSIWRVDGDTPGLVGNTYSSTISYNAVFSSNGQLAATDLYGEEVVVWQVEVATDGTPSLRSILQFDPDLDSEVRDLQFDPSSEYLVISHGNGVEVYGVSTRSWVNEACAIANRRLSENERREFLGGAEDSLSCKGR